MTDIYYISIITLHDGEKDKVTERYAVKPELVTAIRSGLGVVWRLTDD